MPYSILELATLAGVTTRTLRFYDQKGLLCPSRGDSSGYRVYGAGEVDRLQQILLYRELGLRLGDIKRLMEEPGFDAAEALREHRSRLVEHRNRLNRLIDNVDKTLSAHEGGLAMTDTEKFEGFKRELIEENERAYGTEIREKYGGEAVDASNQKLLDLREEEYATMQNLAAQILETLKAAFAEGDPAGEAAQACAALHRKWLTFSWPSYSPEAHAGLAQMYVDDPRFTAYYDEPIGPGAAAFLRDAVRVYTGQAPR